MRSCTEDAAGRRGKSAESGESAESPAWRRRSIPRGSALLPDSCHALGATRTSAAEARGCCCKLTCAVCRSSRCCRRRWSRSGNSPCSGAAACRRRRGAPARTLQGRGAQRLRSIRGGARTPLRRALGSARLLSELPVLPSQQSPPSASLASSISLRSLRVRLREASTTFGSFRQHEARSPTLILSARISLLFNKWPWSAGGVPGDLELFRVEQAGAAACEAVLLRTCARPGSSAAALLLLSCCSPAPLLLLSILLLHLGPRLTSSHCCVSAAASPQVR